MPHRIDVPVTWGDTDAGGLIYFPRYFHFVIVGLNAYFEPIDGHLMESLREDGYVLPAVDASATFDAPLRAGETARVEIRVDDVGEASLSVAFTVTRAADEVLGGRGTVTFVLVDESFEAAPLPETVRETVEKRRSSQR